MNHGQLDQTRLSTLESEVRWDESLPKFLKRSMPKTDLFFRGNSFKPWWNSCFSINIWGKCGTGRLLNAHFFFSPLIIVCIEILFSNLFVKMSASSQHSLPWWSNNLHDNFLFKQHRRISALNAHGKLQQLPMGLPTSEATCCRSAETGAEFRPPVGSGMSDSGSDSSSLLLLWTQSDITSRTSTSSSHWSAWGPNFASMQTYVFAIYQVSISWVRLNCVIGSDWSTKHNQGLQNRLNNLVFC